MGTENLNTRERRSIPLRMKVVLFKVKIVKTTFRIRAGNPEVLRKIADEAIARIRAVVPEADVQEVGSTAVLGIHHGHRNRDVYYFRMAAKNIVTILNINPQL